MTARQHGGPRTPAKPAAVSTPQSGARTDGGAADPQGVRVASGGPHGARQAAVAQQQGAPVAGSSPSPGGAPTAVGAPAGPEGAFGPTQRPNESITAGASPVGDLMSQNFDTSMILLQAVYDRYPSPYIAALMNRE